MPPDQYGMLRQNPGFAPAMIVMYEGIMARAERVLLDYTREGVSVRYNVDGVWRQAQGRDRMTGDALLVVLKSFALLDPAERRGKQNGFFSATLNKDKFQMELTTEGVKTGERVLLDMRHKKKDIPTLVELGMREKSVEKLKEWMLRDKGLILFSSPADTGLRTTYRAALNSTDRFMRDFRTVENKHRPEPEIINVEPDLFDPEKGEAAHTHIPKMILREPDVICVPEITTESAKVLCEVAVKHSQLTFTRLRAKDCVEAMLRFLMLKPDPEQFAESLIGVVNQRLLRKLCQCKEAYQPPPQLLHKLGIPQGRVSAFYREKKPLTPEQIRQLEEAKQPVPPPCPQCQAGGYYGRTGIFEILEVNDEIREALVKRPQMEHLRSLAQAAGARSFQDEAILQVALGTTSLTEAQRVLKT